MQPPLLRASLSSGGNRFAKEHTIAHRAAAKQCPVTFMCGNEPWERKRTAIQLAETIGGITCAHQPERRGRRCRVTHPHAPTGVVHTATAVPVHSKPIRQLRHTIEWHVTFFDGIFAESFFAVCKTVHPRDGTTCPRSGAVLQGPQIQPEAHSGTGHQAFGQRLFVRIGIRASEYQVAAESEAR